MRTILGILSAVSVASVVWTSAAAQTTSINAIASLARSGDGAAQKMLGIHFEVSGDLDRAAYWYKMSALSNNARGQLLLANAYQHGRGVPQSATLAFAWYMVASGQCRRKQISVEAHNGPDPTETEWNAAKDLSVLLAMLVGKYTNAPNCEEFEASSRWSPDNPFAAALKGRANQ